MKKKIESKVDQGTAFLRGQARLFLKYLGDPYTIKELSNLYTNSLHIMGEIVDSKKIIDKKRAEEIRKNYMSLLKIVRRGIDLELEYIENNEVASNNDRDLKIDFDETPKKIIKKRN